MAISLLPEAVRDPGGAGAMDGDGGDVDLERIGADLSEDRLMPLAHRAQPEIDVGAPQHRG